MDGWISLWPAAVLMVVVASWILYRYVAPKSWREWSRAGLVQAFIIALYAEMYGFPLSLYVLTGVLGVDIPLRNESGHLWATLLGYGRVGALIEMVVGYVFVAAGVVLLAAGWRETYRARREDRIATEGVYGVVRHPQYLGLFMALFGQIIHWPTIITVVLFPIIVLAYVRLARREERDMVSRFGEAYRSYQESVPRFFPGRGQWGVLFRRTRRRLVEQP